MNENDSEISSIKIHATEKLTLTGPLIWAEMPTADVQQVLSKYIDQRTPTIGDFDFEGTSGATVIFAFAYIAFSAPAVTIIDIFSRGAWMNTL